MFNNTRKRAYPILSMFVLLQSLPNAACNTTTFNLAPYKGAYHDCRGSFPWTVRSVIHCTVRCLNTRDCMGFQWDGDSDTPCQPCFLGEVTSIDLHAGPGLVYPKLIGDDIYLDIDQEYYLLDVPGGLRHGMIVRLAGKIQDGMWEFAFSNLPHETPGVTWYWNIYAMHNVDGSYHNSYNTITLDYYSGYWAYAQQEHELFDYVNETTLSFEILVLVHEENYHVHYVGRGMYTYPRPDDIALADLTYVTCNLGEDIEMSYCC